MTHQESRPDQEIDMVPMEPVQSEPRVPDNLYLPAKVNAALALGIGAAAEVQLLQGMTETAYPTFRIAGAVAVGAVFSGLAGRVGEYFILRRK